MQNNTLSPAPEGVSAPSRATRNGTVTLMRAARTAARRSPFSQGTADTVPLAPSEAQFR